MKIYIKTYDLSKKKPDKKVLDWCMRNNYSSRRVADDGYLLRGSKFSHMKNDLINSLSERRDYILLAHDGTKPIGWGLLRFNFRKEHELQLYVPPRKRRMGIGTRIVHKAIEKYKKFMVFCGTENENFFDTFKMDYSCRRVIGKK